MVRIYLNDIAKYNFLGCSDLRTIKKWCNENGIEIFRDGSRPYINHATFEEIYNADQVEGFLKKEYPNNWEDMYNLYNTGNVLEIIKHNKQNQKSKVNTYRPKSKGTQEFLDNL